MKTHIETLNINIGNANQIPAGLIAALAVSRAAKIEIKTETAISKIGDKWPGTEAIYAGKSLSLDGDKMIHLIVWPDEGKDLNYQDAVSFAEKVNPDMNSHVPTRIQLITLFDNLQDRFSKDSYYWTLTKTKSGQSAFIQYFSYGGQDSTGLDYELRVRAVSEIPL